MKETEFKTVYMVTYVCLKCNQEFSEDIGKSTNFELLACPKCGKQGNFKIRNISVRKEAR